MAHIAVTAKLLGLDRLRHIVISGLDPGDDGVEGRDRLLNIDTGAVVGHGGKSILLRGVVEVHPADFVAGALFD